MPDVPIKTLGLIVSFWCCIAAAVIAQDYQLDRAVQYAERASFSKASLVSPDGRIFMAMPSP
jgi:hypothetical protein